MDTLRKGAMMVLRQRPDCSQITISDKSVNKPNTYYVTCRVNGSVENVFFTDRRLKKGRSLRVGCR